MCSAKTEYIATILMKSKDIFRFIFEIASIIKTRILHRRRSLSSCKYTPKKRPRKTPGALWVLNLPVLEPLFRGLGTPLGNAEMDTGPQ